MNDAIRHSLLAPGDPPPVRVSNPQGRSPFLLLGDHAGRAIPVVLGTLGLEEPDLARHIACDIGTLALGETLALGLGAVFINQAYSRLIVDCNRAPDAPDAVAQASDGTPVPGNRHLGEDARRARFDEVHEPYHRAIAEEIAARERRGAPPVLVSLHSFTPRMGGQDRPWDVGVLHDGGDPWFARAVLAGLQGRGDLTVGDNQPYRMDSTDYTIPRHAYPASRPYVELEIRQDLLLGPADRRRWSQILREALEQALSHRSCSIAASMT